MYFPINDIKSSSDQITIKSNVIQGIIENILHYDIPVLRPLLSRHGNDVASLQIQHGKPESLHLLRD